MTRSRLMQASLKIELKSISTEIILEISQWYQHRRPISYPGNIIPRASNWTNIKRQRTTTRTIMKSLLTKSGTSRTIRPRASSLTSKNSVRCRARLSLTRPGRLETIRSSRNWLASSETRATCWLHCSIWSYTETRTTTARTLPTLWETIPRT